MKIQLLLIFILIYTNSVAEMWTQKASFPGLSREGAYSFVIGDKAYVGFGLGANGAIFQTFWEYDKTGNVWTQKCSYPGVPRYAAIGFAANGMGYVGLGYDYVGLNYFKDFYKYDPVTDTWTQLPDIFQEMAGCTAISADSIGFIYGGYWEAFGNVQTHNLLWKFDPVTETWSQAAPFPGTWRFDPGAFAVNGKIYLSGGETLAGPTLNETWEYDITGNTWTQKASFNQRSFMASFAIGNFGYLGTGDIPPIYVTNTFFRYDPSTNSWQQRINFGGAARRGAVGFAITGTGFIGLGRAGSQSAIYFNDLWEYDANQTTGLNEINSFSLTIYPNPASETIYILSNEHMKRPEIKLFDDSGGLVREISGISGNRFVLHKEALSPGIYFLIMKVEGKPDVCRKIVFTG